MTADFPEEPGALKGHARIRGGESQQWLIYPTSRHLGRIECAGSCVLQGIAPRRRITNPTSGFFRPNAFSVLRSRRRGERYYRG